MKGYTPRNQKKLIKTSLMRDLLIKHIETIEQIFSNFGMKDSYGELDIRTNVKWDMCKDEVKWIEDGCMYANEIRGIAHYFETYVILNVYNGSGDKYYQIFNMDLRDANIEETEE
jgi:hypothetical protein